MRGTGREGRATRGGWNKGGGLLKISPVKTAEIVVALPSRAVLKEQRRRHHRIPTSFRADVLENL